MKNPLETLSENNEGKPKLERLHEEVMKLGEMALEWKNRCNAMELALETERQAADRYARQVAHWIAKHDELLEDQLRTVPQEWNDKNVIAWCIARGIRAAEKPVKQCLDCLHYNEPLASQNCASCIHGGNVDDNFVALGKEYE